MGLIGTACTRYVLPTYVPPCMRLQVDNLAPIKTVSTDQYRIYSAFSRGRSMHPELTLDRSVLLACTCPHCFGRDLIQGLLTRTAGTRVIVL